RQGGAGRFRGNPAALRRRYISTAGQARSAAQTHRALLRGLPDHQERPEGLGDDAKGVSPPNSSSSRRTPRPKRRVLSFQATLFDGFRATRTAVVMGPRVRRGDRKMSPEIEFVLTLALQRHDRARI